MGIPQLARYIAEAPKTPGVYTWRDGHGKPLYIGKAANLKSRLSNYLPAGRQVIKSNSRIQLMVKTAASLTWQETATDIEALIIESQSIKRWRPRFNIIMRDDKQYFYVAITKDEFPRIFLTHQPVIIKNSKLKIENYYAGPFTEGTPLKSTLRVLRRLFPYCTCKTKHNIRCLNTYIGNCLGVCCLRQPDTIFKSQFSIYKKQYRKNIRAIHDILTGKRSTLISKLKQEMKTAGKNHELERAMHLQNQIEHVQRVFDNAQVNAANQRSTPRHHGALGQMVIEFGLDAAPLRIEGYDVADIQGQHANGAMVAFTDGRADNKEYRLFNIRGADLARRSFSVGGDTAMLNETIIRRLSHLEWPLPDLIIVDGGKGQLDAAISAIENCKLKIPIIALTKNDRHQGDHVLFIRNSKLEIRNLSDLPRQLADLIIHVDAEAHRFAIRHYRKRHSRQLLS